ncbi:uncharacterized protein [Eurosta solidaginis]|uniref:uncharacterized protein n=1 Tax=Eurosta solidaginis TaxID=178769 RepID=UPI003531353D
MMSLEIFWDEYKNVAVDEKQRNVLIRDIPQKWLLRICEYMVEHSFRPNRIFQHLGILDIPNVVDNYRRIVMHLLRDECSLMVIDVNTEEILGVALVKLMTKEWRSWISWLQLLDMTSLYGEFMLLQRMLVLKYDNENSEHHIDSLHLFEYYLKPELSNDNIFMSKFFNSICTTARHMLMSRVSFIAVTLKEQQQAELFNFETLTFLIYSLVEHQGVRPFQSLRDIDEMYLILYERQVKPLTPFYRMPPPDAYDEADRLKHEPHTALKDNTDDESVNSELHRPVVSTPLK